MITFDHDGVIDGGNMGISIQRDPTVVSFKMKFDQNLNLEQLVAGGMAMRLPGSVMAAASKRVRKSDVEAKLVCFNRLMWIDSSSECPIEQDVDRSLAAMGLRRADLVETLVFGVQHQAALMRRMHGYVTVVSGDLSWPDDQGRAHLEFGDGGWCCFDEFQDGIRWFNEDAWFLAVPID